MIDAQDGTIDGNPPIDTRNVEYVALKAVCVAYLEGKTSGQELSLFHCCMDSNAHLKEETFGDHPIFRLMDYLWHFFADQNLPEELCIPEYRQKEIAEIAHNRLRGMVGLPTLYPVTDPSGQAIGTMMVYQT